VRFRPGRVDLRTALLREAARLGIGLEAVRLHGHPIPCYQAPPWPLWRVRPQERLSTRRCLLVGDAGGLVDPLLGEGIRYAITSAQLAAEAIASGDLAGYEAAVWREIGHSLATAGMTARLFYRWPRHCFELGVRNRATVQELVDLVTGRSSYEGIGRRLIVATARWLLRERPWTADESRLTLDEPRIPIGVGKDRQP
jgi:flavin-dependent dehydrogenase